MRERNLGVKRGSWPLGVLQAHGLEGSGLLEFGLADQFPAAVLQLREVHQGNAYKAGAQLGYRVQSFPSLQTYCVETNESSCEYLKLG